MSTSLDERDVCSVMFESEMALLSIYCSIEIIQTIMCLISIYQTIKIRKQQSIWCILSLLTFYLSSITFGISRISTTIFYCFLYDYYWTSWSIIFISYCVHVIALEMVFLSRLKFVFKDTQYSVTNICTMCTCSNWIFCVIGGSFILLNAHFRFPGVTQGITLGIVGVFIIITLLTTQILAWMFVIKLTKLNKETTRHSMDDTIQTNDHRLLRTIRKYAVLSVFSVMFTTFYAIINIIFTNLSGKYDYELFAISAVILCLDVFMDTLCMTLSLSMNDKYYQLLCSCFHRKCCDLEMNEMRNNAVHKIRTSIASITRQTTIATPTTPDSPQIETFPSIEMTIP